MIRANLLPPAREALSVFGLHVDRRLVREAVAGLVVLALVSAATYGIQRARLSGLRSDAERLERSVAADAARRRIVAAEASDVARLEQLQREADSRRRSGNAVAATLVGIGNAMPQRVWLDGIDRTAAGFAISGAAASLEDVGETLNSVGRAMPAYAPSLTRVTREEGADTLHFSLQLEAKP